MEIGLDTYLQVSFIQSFRESDAPVAGRAANRDDRQFTQPNELDITRSPNKHLSFGLGIHFCLGSPLARLEGQIAINTLVQRTTDLRLAVPPQSLKWRRGLVLRGMKSLPLRQA